MTEKDSLPCPGCHTALPPEATGCQICMRPRTRQEIMRGYAKLRDDKARKRRRPFQILAALLLLGGAGWLVKERGSELKAPLSSGAAAVGRWADDMRNPSNYASRKEPEPAPKAEPSEPGGPVAPESALRSQLFPDDYARSAPSEGGPGGAPAGKPAAQKPLKKNAWRVSGTVYDLATLEPVAGAKVVFLRDEKELVEETTDDAGAYAADLSNGGGWTVALQAPNRRRGQILDLDPSYRVRDDDERRAVYDNVSVGDLAPAPVEWSASTVKTRLDLFAVPHHWTRRP
ncbi:MAG: carboxypeptidase-like regulatory domain-containing protein [Elusimicrobiota bacterium]|nr:carboxypeptidase-like regulatory domain-containing protein [Elusimicrobiota bacterium]